MSRISEHVDALRDLRPRDRRVPDPSVIRALADDIFGLVPLEQTMGRAELAGYTEADAALIAEQFGKFRARSNKGSVKAETFLIEEAGFLVPPTREQVLRMAEVLRAQLDNPHRRITGAAATWLAGVDPAFLGEVPAVIIPSGYEPRILGRNIRASLGALVKDLPSDAEIERFWTRHYDEPEPELTAEHVHLMWWLARHELGHKLADMPAEAAYLNELLVRAHDLLEVARTDAVEALDRLAGPHAHQESLDDLTDWVGAVSWTHQGMFARIRAVLDALGQDDSPRLRSVLQARLGTIARWADGSQALLTDIAHLSEAHLHLLVKRSGLAFNAAEEKKVRAELRTRLVEMGLSADLDQELPAGVAAWRQDRLAEFYASREARAAGDPDWRALFAAEDPALAPA